MLDFGKLIAETVPVVSVSGREFSAHEYFKKLCAPYFDEVRADRNGSVIAVKKCGKPGAPKLLIDAHIDEIGLVVTEITEKGFIRFAPIGGVDAGILPALELLVYGKKVIRGVVAAPPPHLLSAEQRGKRPEISSLYLDVGYTKEELEKIVSVGDVIGFVPNSSRMLSDRYYSKGMDDRSCCLCIIGAVELLSGRDMKYDVYAVFSSREETGTLGILSSAYAVDPDLAIVVDVDHALLPDGSNKGAPVVGGGAIVTYSDNLSRALSDALLESAKRSRATYQITAFTGPTGTNATALQISRHGVPSVILSLPLKNMHTPVELGCVSDMESVSTVIAQFVCDGGFDGKEVVLIDD